MDDIDAATERQDALDRMALAAARLDASRIAPGHAGTCDMCGDESPRLMGADYFKRKRFYGVAANIFEGICPPCRDKHRLP